MFFWNLHITKLENLLQILLQPIPLTTENKDWTILNYLSWAWNDFYQQTNSTEVYNYWSQNGLSQSVFGLIYYNGEVTLGNDYYPGGSLQPGRTFNANSYRFGGAGGQEKDDEIAGDGNSYTAKYWQYDSRLLRRWNRDLITYPWQSTYAVNNNNPIIYTDPLGLYGTKGKAERKQRRAIKKYGEDRVSEVFNRGSGELTGDTSEDADWGYTVTAAGRDQSSTGTIDSNGDIKISHAPTTGVFGWFSSTKLSVKEWFHTTDFVVEGGGSVKVGVAAKVTGGINGIGSATLEANLVSYELLHGRVDVTELGSNNPNAYSGGYIGDGDGTKVTQDLKMTIAVLEYEVLGGKVETSFKTHGYGYYDYIAPHGNFYLVVPLIKKETASKIETKIKVENRLKMDASKIISNPKIKIGKEFYGVDLSAEAQLILGVKVNLKLGFRR